MKRLCDTVSIIRGGNISIDENSFRTLRIDFVDRRKWNRQGKPEQMLLQVNISGVNKRF